MQAWEDSDFIPEQRFVGLSALTSHDQQPVMTVGMGQPSSELPGTCWRSDAELATAVSCGHWEVAGGLLGGRGTFVTFSQ